MHDRASYLVACLDLDSRKGKLLFAGGCLLGIGNTGIPIWLNTPHTVEAHFQRYPFKTSMNMSGTEHFLTREFKGRRFIVPENRLFVWSEGVSLFFSTDGHWREHLRDGVELECLQDDASFLKVTFGTAPFTVQQSTDTPNLFIVDRGDLPDMGMCPVIPP